MLDHSRGSAKVYRRFIESDTVRRDLSTFVREVAVSVAETGFDPAAIILGRLEQGYSDTLENLSGSEPKRTAIAIGAAVLGGAPQTIPQYAGLLLGNVPILSGWLNELGFRPLGRVYPRWVYVYARGTVPTRSELSEIRREIREALVKSARPRGSTRRTP